METQLFGDWLKEQLDKRGWIAAELARRMEVWSSLVSKWINNTQRPRPDQCRRMAEALGIDPDTVLEAAGHRPRDQDEPGLLRHEARVLLSRIPEDLIAVVIPMLRALAEEANQEEIRDNMKLAHRPGKRPQPTATAHPNPHPLHGTGTLILDGTGKSRTRRTQNEEAARASS